ncbi:MAG TPA: DNA alkylation repair protein [Methanobacterium sp.]|nr:DNA alkylation repair protein [Methanobacterium sp.]
MKLEKIIKELESLSNPEDIAGMARFGIESTQAYGVRMPELTRIARETGKNHELAEELWQHGHTETRILAAMIDDPKQVTEEQMDRWASEFNSWDVCDQCCMKLFRKTPYAYHKIEEWSTRKEEFVKRAAFTLIATLAVHDKEADDEKFKGIFPIIVREASDNRNFVKKAVNWALRQIGKRNQALNQEAIIIANEINKLDYRSAKWIAKDALRELESVKVQERLEEKALKSR